MPAFALLLLAVALVLIADLYAMSHVTRPHTPAGRAGEPSPDTTSQTSASAAVSGEETNA